MKLKDIRIAMKKSAMGLMMLSACLFADDAQTDGLTVVEKSTDNSSPTMMNQDMMKNTSPKKSRTSWNYDQSGFMVYGEFLWWKLDESPTDYAYSKNIPVYQIFSSAAPNDGLVGEEHRAEPTWSPGFRVGLAYQFAYAPWTLEGEYTRFTSENDDKAHRPDFAGVQNFTNGQGMADSVAISTLNNTFSGFLIGNPISIKSKLQFDYNTAHINFIRHLFADTSFVLSPYFGAQIAFINQDWHMRVDSDYTNSTTSKFFTTKTSWDFKGGGIDIGVNIDWYWGAGFSFYANGCAAALYGNHKHSLSTIISPAPIEVYQDTSKTETRTAQMTQLSAGIEWSYLFRSQAIALFAGWEFNTWYNLMEVRRFVESPTINLGGDTFPTYTKSRAVDKSQINIQGFVAGAKWVF